MRIVVAAALGLALAASASAATVDRTGFRYARELQAPPGPVRFDPDGPLFAHTRPDFADLRILDADGRQVPWRRLPPAGTPTRTRVPVLSRGGEPGNVVALLDLGPRRRIHNSIELEFPAGELFASVVVLGSHDRRRFVRIAEVHSAELESAIRSPEVSYPPTDFRYLQVRATAVGRVVGATVAYTPPQPALRRVEARTTMRRRGISTVVDLDLGFENVPVDRIDVDATTRRFDRPVTVTFSNHADRGFTFAGSGRVVRFRSVSHTSVLAGAAARYFRLEIANGDDPPLAGLRVTALAQPRTLLLPSGFRPPYRLLYGNPRVRAPRYDFAAIPPDELPRDRARPGRLGAEAENREFEPPEDTRSFAERHPVVVQAALVLAALAVAGAGLLALRRRPS